MKCQDSRKWFTIFVLTAVYVVGELSHFLLGIVTRPMSQEIHYGDKGCLADKNFTEYLENESISCFEANSSVSCDQLGGIEGSNETACVWNYSGLGLEYQILAGPAFIAVFTISGVIIAMISDRYNRHIVVTVCLIVLTGAMALTGVATQYWHLFIFRMAIGAGESSFSPACSSMVSDIISENRRGLALGIFNWGIYFGYGLSYAIGNFVTEANIMGMGWRWSYYISGCLGLIVIILLIATVEEPVRRTCVKPTANLPANSYNLHNLSPDGSSKSSSVVSISSAETSSDSHVFVQNIVEGEAGLKQVFNALRKPTFIMLIVAASVRHTAGFTWAYNTQLYYSTYYPTYNLGIWITAISICGGAMGVATGGFVSDKLVTKLGLKARIYVLAGSQFLAVPFAAGVLYFAPPVSFYCLLVSYIFAEMWFGVLFAVLLALVPSRAQSTTLAIFLFAMNNVGGNAPVLVEPLRKALNYRAALLIMYPGLYLTSSSLFFSVSFFIHPERK